MKTQITFFCTFFIAISILFFSCKKDKAEGPPPCNNCPVYYTADVKKWLYFQPGTYWVYEEQTSGDIDCVYVTNNTYDDGNPQSAFFRCETYSTYYTYYFNLMSNNPIVSNCYPYFVGEKGCVLVLRDKTKPGDFVGETILFVFRPVVGDLRYTWNSTGSTVLVEDILDTLVVSDSTYFNVPVIKESINITEDVQQTRFFFCEGKGIIKKELLDSAKTWSLIRYNIVQ